jgi:uroporphyrinogen decarboxylase
MVHPYGARKMLHCCGSVRKPTPRLIEIGLDILEAVQVSAVRMDIRELHDAFKKTSVYAAAWMCRLCF